MRSKKPEGEKIGGFLHRQPFVQTFGNDPHNPQMKAVHLGKQMLTRECMGRQDERPLLIKVKSGRSPLCRNQQSKIKQRNQHRNTHQNPQTNSAYLLHVYTPLLLIKNRIFF